jgi:glycosyltransferase involved in cell wall biosynthesis
MKKPLVSVNIPVYNGGKNLEECLTALANQTYDNYEVIVVDNNSTDNSGEIIKKFEKKNKKLSYTFEEKKGRSYARNAAIKESKGKIIAMVDCDCIVSKKWISEITKPIICGKEGIVQGSFYIDSNDRFERFLYARDLENIQSLIRGRYLDHIQTGNLAIKSSILKKYLFDERLKAAEDVDLFFRLKEKYKVYFLKSCRIKLNYNITLLKLFAKQYERGKYFKYSVYYNNIILKESIINKQRDLGLKNTLSLTKKVLRNFLKINPKNIPYLIIKNTGWGMGIVAGNLGFKFHKINNSKGVHFKKKYHKINMEDIK